MSELSMPRSRPADGLGDKARPARLAALALMASPLLFGVPVLLGIVVSLARLLGLRYPYLGWATTVNSDAEQLYLGHTLYQSPAHGYTGQIYTPGYPALVSLFDRLYLWNGWALVVVILATVSLIALAARLAYTRTSPAPRALNLIAAVAVGGVAYWCVASVKLALLDESRADQLAWALALFGLIAVADFGRAPSRRRVVVAVLLLSAALWTKQTTVAVALVATVWVLALAFFSCLDRRAAALFVALLCALNLALLLVLNLLTHGWEFYINFEVATLQGNEFTYGENLVKGVQCIPLAVGFVLATWLARVAGAIWRRRDRDQPPPGQTRRDVIGERLRRVLVAEDPSGRRALLLAIYIVVGFALAMYFMRKQGTETNQLIGVVWALGLLAAVGWRLAQRHLVALATSGACVLALFVLPQLGPIREAAASADVSIPALEQAEQWQPLPPELIAYARQHTIWMPLLSDLNVPEGGPLYPNYYNFADLLAAGNQPLYLVHALLDRRFDAVSYIPLEGEGYTSASGKWEENYLWKLDEVIAARYAPTPELPGGLLGRRPGPEKAAWMRDCFGPFSAAGASFRIHHGGGFWCSFSSNHLQLVRTPAPLSEVLTTHPVHAQGAISVRLEDHPSGQVELELLGGSGAEWAARVTPAPGNHGELAIATYMNGALLGGELVKAKVLPGGGREIQLELAPTSANPGAPVAGGGAEATLSPPAGAAPFAIVAASGATLDLHDLRLTQ